MLRIERLFLQQISSKEITINLKYSFFGISRIASSCSRVKLINPPLQSENSLCFFQTFDRSFSKRNVTSKAHIYNLESFLRFLMWGWVFLERTHNLSRFQFTRHFIEIVVVETKRFVSSNVNVILTRQTCGQRSSMSAAGKRRALENCFLERICHMVPMSKCRRD